MSSRARRVMKPKILIVTPDFEQVSTFKRKLIYKELTQRQSPWTLLFFTQRFYKGDYDRYAVFERSTLRDLSGESELLKEIETYG